MTKNARCHMIPLIGLVGNTLAGPVSPFVTSRDMRFYLEGKEHFVFSANYWTAMNLGAVDAAGGNRTRLLRDLDNMKAQGINNLRIMASSEGPNDQPWRMTPTLMTSPGVYNEEILDGLDFAMAEIGKRGMKAVMTMNDYWHWSGGYSQYVSWVTGQDIPYPPSWDPKNPYHWSEDNDNHKWGTFVEFSARFYKDPKIYSETQKIYQNHIAAIVNRINKYTGLAYKDDPTVFSWQLTNEPQNPDPSWVSETAKFIKSIAPNHMVTVGLESKNDELEFLDAHNHSEIDYATVHIWAQNRGVYDMMNESESNIANTITWGKSWIDKANDWAKAINKPMILEEFGLARDNWVAGDKATGNELFSPDHTTRNRDRYYEALMTAAAHKHRDGGAFAGFGFWAYAGESRPSDRLISDPPHEAPGWYAVYDKDVSTFEAMKKALKEI